MRASDRTDAPAAADLLTAVQPLVRTMQIIMGVMFLATVVFFGVVIFLPSIGPQRAAGGQSFVTWVAIGLAILMLPASWIVPNVVVAQMRRAVAAGEFQMPGDDRAPPRQQQNLDRLGPAGPFCVIYQTKMILGAALREGSAFFSLAAFMLEGNVAALITAAIMMTAVLSKFPTAARVAHWIAAQQRLLEEERALAR